MLAVNPLQLKGAINDIRKTHQRFFNTRSQTSLCSLPTSPVFSRFYSDLKTGEQEGTQLDTQVQSAKTPDVQAPPKPLGEWTSKPLVGWTKEEVQQWFLSSKYSDYAPKFLGLDGKDLAGLPKEDYQKELGNIQGSAFYNAVQALNGDKAKLGHTAVVDHVIRRATQNAMKIDSTKSVHNIPLQERSNQLRDVVKCVAGNLCRFVQPTQQISNTAKTDLMIPVFAGGSGIGKTVLAQESAQEVFRNWKEIAPPEYQNAKLLYLKIDFGNGARLTSIEREFPPEIIMGLRLAWAHFIQGKYQMNFERFVETCGASTESFTVASVMNAIQADLQLAPIDKLFTILHIDEVQLIFDFEKEYKNPNPKGLFKLLINAIGGFFKLDPTTIQPFISGTAHRKVMESKEPTMYTFEFIDTPLLSLGAVFNLMEHYARLFGANTWQWKLQLPFLQLLGDMGGLPRAISYLLEECFGKDYSKGPECYSQGREFFETISFQSFYPIFNRIANSITKKYGLEGFVLKNKAAALQILNHAIRNINVTRDEVLGNVVVEQMEQDGHIFLHRVGTDYYFRMPFLFIFIYNQHLRIIPRELAEVAFNHDNRMTWQDWESFNSLFQVFINNFLLYEKGKINLPLGDFYYKGDGHDDTKNLCVELGPLEVAPIVHRFPSKTQSVLHKDTGKKIDWASCRYLLLNGKSAEFGDTVLPRVAEKQSAQKYFRRQVNIIIISGQQKWDYNGYDFTLAQAVKEHKTAFETAKREGLPDSCGLITVIFTTQPLPKEKIQSIPRDILIIHQGNFKDYYGPFAARAAFSVAHDLNPNFADIQHLQALEGVGEETAKEIVQERQKRPFENLDDLCARVPRVKKNKLTRELSFFPFTSKRLLLPFEGYTTQ